VDKTERRTRKVVTISHVAASDSTWRLNRAINILLDIAEENTNAEKEKPTKQAPTEGGATSGDGKIPPVKDSIN
jgi:hypothetical protein